MRVVTSPTFFYPYRAARILRFARVVRTSGAAEIPGIETPRPNTAITPPYNMDRAVKGILARSATSAVNNPPPN